MSTQSFAELCDLQVHTVNSRSYSSKSKREKLINIVDKELTILNERNDLTLRRKVDMDGNEKKEFELRSWKRNSTDPNVGDVCVRFQNKIFGFGSQTNKHKPTYFKCEYTVDSVRQTLETIKKQLESMDDNDDMFKDVSSSSI